MADETEPPRPSSGRRGRPLSKNEFQAQVKAGRERFEEANQKITARTGRNLLYAILIGVAMGAVLVVSLVLIKEVFMVLAAAVTAFCTLELIMAFRKATPVHVPRIPSMITAIAVVPAAYYWQAAGQWLVFLGGVLLIALWRLAEAGLRRPAVDDGRRLLRDLAAGTFVQVYVSFLGSTAILLLSKDGGQWWVLAFIAVVVLTDTGAYATGLNFGKHPMAPTISPKKTWEGFAGAVVIAVIGGVLLSIFLLHEPWWFGLLFGLLISLTATVGDLCESLLKRDIGIKDMSSWLPGHGGLLDRLDSILPSAAVAYVLYVLITG
ncbi:phosphatidate cytidylyltransferase [Cnuibacter sp. UC19_7]|uniref:phosphatidate cytidylyltransferase n=1 Tax=Cnuibacter sp. UC19_7 TaxID=3350166 RepID=UPI00366B9E50